MSQCDIKNEVCGGKCSGWDGKLDKTILIPKNTNAWEARKKIVEKIPCDICRKEAIPLEDFTHDIVNGRLGKPIHDKENFKKHAKIISCLCAKTGVC